MSDRYTSELSELLATQTFARKVLSAHASLLALAEDAGSHWTGRERPKVLWVDGEYASGRGVLLVIEVGEGESFDAVAPVLEAILDRGLVARRTIEDVNSLWAWRQWPFAEERRRLPEHPIKYRVSPPHPMLHVRANVRPGAACLVKVETEYHPGGGKLLCPGDPGYAEEVERRSEAEGNDAPYMMRDA